MNNIEAVTSYWAKDDKYYIVVLPEYIDDTWVFEYNGNELTCTPSSEDDECVEPIVIQINKCDDVTLEALDYTVDEYDGLVHIRFIVAEDHPKRINKQKTKKKDDKQTSTNKKSDYSNLWKTYDELMESFDYTPYKNPYKQYDEDFYKCTCKTKNEKVDLAKTLSSFNKLFR